MSNGRIETYPEACRVVRAYLAEFCDTSLPHPEMIADAARQAACEIVRLRLQQGLLAKQVFPAGFFGKVKFIIKSLFINSFN